MVKQIQQKKFFMFFNNFFSVNYLDIAPQHASVIMGIGNTFATLPGIVSPIITGYVVQHKVSIVLT